MCKKKECVMTASDRQGVKVREGRRGREGMGGGGGKGKEREREGQGNRTVDALHGFRHTHTHTHTHTVKSTHCTAFEKAAAPKNSRI